MLNPLKNVEEIPSAQIFDNLGENLGDNLVWMTSEEAARYLRKTVGALRTAVCRRQLHARKWRRRLYFKRSELDRLLETSENKGGI